MEHQLSQEQAMEIMMNGFINNEATPSILGVQVPNFIATNSNLLNNHQSSGLQARYNVLLGIIEELKKDIRPTYASSKTSAERLKRNINLARIEIRNCIQELERCGEQPQQQQQQQQQQQLQPQLQQ